MNDHRIRPLLKGSKDANISFFFVSQDYYELPKGTITASGKKYHIFKTNKFRGVQNLYQDTRSMDMTLVEFI